MIAGEMNATRKKFLMTLYLGKGWLILVAFRPLILPVPPPSLAWLMACGIAYASGVFFFVSKRSGYIHFAGIYLCSSARPAISLPFSPASPHEDFA